MIKTVLTVCTGNARVHVWAYHSLATHTLLDTTHTVDVFHVRGTVTSSVERHAKGNRRAVRTHQPTAVRHGRSYGTRVRNWQTEAVCRYS
jgi:hypothetical protein